MSSSRNDLPVGPTLSCRPCRALVIMLAALASAIAWAAPGDIDVAFGEAGRVIGRYMYGLDAAVLLGQGELVLIGNDGDFLGDFGQNLVLQKIDSDGRILVSDVFVDSGYFDDGAERAVVAPDGKILVVGTTCCYPGGFNMAVHRFNHDLSLDLSFGGKGYVLVDLGGDEQGEAMAIEPDGSIVIAGKASRAASQGQGFGHGEPLGIALVRLRVDGSRDPLFADGQMLNSGPGGSSGSALIRDQSGRLLLATSHSASGTNLGCRITRLSSQGRIDPTYAAGGTLALTDPDGDPVLCRDTAMRADGRLVVVGSSWLNADCDRLVCSKAVVALLSPDGQLDSSFNGGFADIPDIGTWNDLQRVQVGDDGNIVVLGLAARYRRQEYCSISDIIVGRISPDGTLDQTFGTGGISLLGGLPTLRRPTKIASLLLDATGRIFAGASYYEIFTREGTWSVDYGMGAVMRLLADGAGPGVVEFDECNGAHQETAGQIAVTVRRTGGSAGAASATYRTVASSAVQDEDYVATSGSLEWPAGDASPRTIVVDVINDNIAERWERFRIDLEGIEGSVPGVVQHLIALEPNDSAEMSPPPAGPPPANGGGGAIDALTLFELLVTVLCLGRLRRTPEK